MCGRIRYVCFREHAKMQSKLYGIPGRTAIDLRNFAAMCQSKLLTFYFWNHNPPKLYTEKSFSPYFILLMQIDFGLNEL